ncbi:hypothetical protein APED_23430 [Acanthopleuribacter pedis]
MRFKDLGKTHKFKLFTLEVRIIYLVSFVGGCLLSFLVFAWQLLPFPYIVNLTLFLLLSFAVGKVSEVPFSKEILYTKLKGRVSIDP